MTVLVLGLASALGVLALMPGNPLMQHGTSTPEVLAQNGAVPQGLGTFSNYSELQTFIAANAKSAQQYTTRGGLFLGGLPVFGNMVTTMTAAATFAPGTSNAAAQTTSSPSYTGTNVQVQGVDEPDIVKTDGTHLFVSTSTAVTIINAYPPSSASVLSTIKLPNGNIQGIEITQNRLLIINERYTNTSHVDILLYNTTNLASPSLMQNESISGNYVASRLANGYLYAIVQQPSYTFVNGNATGVMPLVTLNGATAMLPPSSVYYTPINAQISFYTMVESVSMSSGKVSTVSVLTGPSSTVYVSTQNIYVVYAIYQQHYADNIPGDVFTGGVISAPIQPGGQNSTIFRASYSNGAVTVEAAGTVP
ncbi:MAG: beta-propeller domain-containing protein, partial [Nitrososphaerota archaeon]|nr:beta-propeller domain-containing protein [Nitrososphaerota archaeon]